MIRSKPNLVIFDVDGTLIDSQHTIVSSVRAAFKKIDRPVPLYQDILGIIGLSLPEAMHQLDPDMDETDISTVVDMYKASFTEMRQHNKAATSSVFYPGMYALLQDLYHDDDYLLGIATGKSRAGVERMLDEHNMRHFFCMTQTADDAPSKPSPVMIQNILEHTGIPSQNTVMIGDTSFDMQMATTAGCYAIGVKWGYHNIKILREYGCHFLADDATHLRKILFEIKSEHIV